MFGWYQNCFYLCTRFSEVKYSGCSAVRLAHLLWEQGVPGSNPGTPTNGKCGRRQNNCRRPVYLFSNRSLFSVGHYRLLLLNIFRNTRYALI